MPGVFATKLINIKHMGVLTAEANITTDCLTLNGMRECSSHSLLL